jgi:hypothetical protein
MKKKKPTLVAAVEPVILVPKGAPLHVMQPRHASGKCVVCGSEVAPFSSEQLCWVCRRLKISAWRDAENQAAVQE